MRRLTLLLAGASPGRGDLARPAEVPGVCVQEDMEMIQASHGVIKEAESSDLSMDTAGRHGAQRISVSDIVFSINGSTNFLTAQQEELTKDEPLQKSPELCDELILTMSCRSISGSADGTLTWGKLKKFLSVQGDWPQKFFTKLGYSAIQKPADQEKCSTLCSKVKAYFKAEHVLPPSSDMGCRYRSKYKDEVCDVPLRPTLLRKDMLLLGAVKRKYRYGTPQAAADPSKPDFDSSHHDLIVRIANSFRMYPTPEKVVLKDFPQSIESIFSKNMLTATAWLTRCNNQLGTLTRTPRHRFTTYYSKKWFGGKKGTQKIAQAKIMNRIRSTVNFVATKMWKTVLAQGVALCADNTTIAYVYGKHHCKDGVDWDSQNCSTAGDHNTPIVFICATYFTQPLAVQVATHVHTLAQHSGLKDLRGSGKQSEVLTQEHQVNNVINYEMFVRDLTDNHLAVRDWANTVLLGKR